jgi:hypothetical protein
VGIQVGALTTCEAAMILELMNLYPHQPPLAAYGANVTSQAGEDGIIAHIIKVIEPAERFCVEFGAWDGKKYSNCNTLIKAHRWGGVMIEGDRDRFKDLTETYAGDAQVQSLNRKVDFEGPNRLDAILTECGAPKSFGLLSIDVDGVDYYIWESLHEHSPEIVVIEFNPTVPNDVKFIQDKSFDVHHGCSLLALVLLAKEKGYELVATTMTNAFFVRADKYPRLGIANNFIAFIHQPAMDGRIFQGYDSSIHIVGMEKLMWRGGMPLSSEDFQVLPKSQRRYGGQLKE